MGNILIIMTLMCTCNTGKQASLARINNRTQILKQSQKESNYDTQFSTQQHKEGSPPCLVHTQQKMGETSDLQSTSVVPDNTEKNSNEALDSDVTSSTNTAPIYAVPHKKKKKVVTIRLM